MRTSASTSLSTKSPKLSSTDSTGIRRSAEYLTDKPVGVRHWAADATRVENRLGWEPLYVLEDGIAETLSWDIGRRDKVHVTNDLATLLYER